MATVMTKISKYSIMPCPFWAEIEDFKEIDRNWFSMSLKLKNRIILLFSRNFYSICIVFFLFGSESFGQESQVLSDFKLGKYESVVNQIETQKDYTYKDHIFLAASYKNLKKYNKLIEVLKRASKKFPEKDLLKRELAQAYELKAKSYADVKIYQNLRKENFVKANAILNDLKITNPTAQNLTAYIDYYVRQKDYDEALSLLELYARSYPKGKNYYTKLCEFNFLAKNYDTSLVVCKKASKIEVSQKKSMLYYLKTLKNLGEKEMAEEKTLAQANRFPASVDLQVEAGKIESEKGNSKSSLDYLDRALKIKKTDEALVLKAEELYKIKDYQASLDYFIEACKQHKEPRMPLVLKIKHAGRSLAKKHPFRKKFLSEVDRCKFSYKPKRKMASYN